MVSCVGADLLNTVWPDEFSNQFVKGVFKFAKHVLKDSDSILYIASTTVSGVAAAEVLHVSSNSRECFENGTTKELAGCCAATTVHGQSVAALFLLANS